MPTVAQGTHCQLLWPALLGHNESTNCHEKADDEITKVLSKNRGVSAVKQLPTLVALICTCGLFVAIRQVIGDIASQNGLVPEQPLESLTGSCAQRVVPESGSISSTHVTQKAFVCRGRIDFCFKIKEKCPVITRRATV